MRNFNDLFWELYYMTEKKAQGGVITIPFIALLMAIISSHSLYHLIIRPPPQLKDMSIYMRLSTVGSITCNLIFIFWQVCVFVLGPTLPIRWHCVATQAGSIFVGIGRAFLYLFFLRRLHETFDNTDMNYPKWLLKTIAILSSFTAVTSVIVYVLWMGMENCGEGVTINAALYAISQDLIWSMVTLALFIRVLIKVVKRIERSEKWGSASRKVEDFPSDPQSLSSGGVIVATTTDSNGTTPFDTLPQKKSVTVLTRIKSKLPKSPRLVKNVSNLFMSTRLRAARLVYLMCKLTILTLTAVLSTWTSTAILSPYNAPVFYTADAVINTICLILAFQFYDEWYVRIFRPCRMCCEEPCLRRLRMDDLPARQVHRDVSSTTGKKSSKKSSVGASAIVTKSRSGDNERPTTPRSEDGTRAGIEMTLATSVALSVSDSDQGGAVQEPSLQTALGPTLTVPNA